MIIEDEDPDNADNSQVP